MKRRRRKTIQNNDAGHLRCLEFTQEIPTDAQIKSELAKTRKLIEKSELKLRILEDLLKLNEKGREEALIYMCGLMCLKKYREA